MLMTGSPGAGKTMTARALVSILPPMGIDEAIEVTKLYSIAGRLARDTPLITTRPFCAPHHTTSIPGLVGGGSRIRPGLVSLAHRGVLFLDEMPEFGSKLEVLRQPLEDRVVTLSRAAGNVTYPASIMLVGAQNPCVCGWHGDPQQTCVCSPALVQRYQRRVSGPLLDRIDIHIDVPRVALDRMTEQTVGEPSSSVRARVILARTAQNRRLANSHAIANADMSSEEVRKYCVLDGTGQHLLQAAMRQLQLSARAYHRILKLARTIADLAAADSISSTHLAEALQYRPRQTTEV